MFILTGIKHKIKRKLKLDIDDFIMSVENNTCTQEQATNFLARNHKRLQGQYLERFSKALAINTSITELYFAYYNFDYKEFVEQAKILSEGLKLNKGVKSILFNNSSIDDEAFAYICEALKVNRTIEMIDFSKNNLTEKSCKMLLEILKYNTSLTDIRLSENPIGAGSVAIAEALAFNCSLTRLDLQNAHITSNGMRSIGLALKENTHLKILDISNNPKQAYGRGNFDWGSSSHDKDFIPLFCTLTTSNSLTELDIGCNFFNDKGMSALNHCLKQNKSLTKLSYRYQFHAWPKLVHFLNSLRENQSIRFLDLRSNHISGQSLTAVSDFLETHPQVVSMKFYDCHVSLGDGGEAIAKLTAAFSLHRNLKDFEISSADCGLDNIRSIAHYYTNRNNARSTTILSFNKRFGNKYKFMDKNIMKLIFDFAKLRIEFSVNSTSEQNSKESPEKGQKLNTPLALQFESTLARMNSQIEQIQSSLNNHSATPP